LGEILGGPKKFYPQILKKSCAGQRLSANVSTDMSWAGD